MLKKTVCVILALLVVFCCGSTAFAADSSAKLYTAYGNDMLFKQNETVTLAGTAESGSTITATLLDENDNEITSGEAVATDGTFTVSFDGQPGGYDTYTVVVKENGIEFAELKNVVFGELWLASGQSNMMYPLIQSKDGMKMAEQLQVLSKWLRVYMEPAYPTYKGSDALIPVDPQPEIIGGHWITGQNYEIYSMSAVAYFFAEKMMQELDMPIGILNSSLGGSSIYSWLSREAIDSDEKLKNILIADGDYTPRADWNESETDIYNDMTSNYNLRTYSYRNFRVSGMIWYQGESELMYSRSTERYAAELDLMQRSYADLFNYDGERLPLILTQLAAYYYSDDGFVLAQRNFDFTVMQQSHPDSLAVTSQYDLPVTFLPEVGVIHPEHKTEIGQRMAFAAMGLVYGKRDTYTVATPGKTEIKDGSIYVTFKNVGDGLKINGNEPKCFTICGEDGIHIPAKAEILSNNTVRIWSESITQPKSASYAYCVTNERANLYATENGELALPVSPFDTDTDASVRYWRDMSWMDCDNEMVWHNHGDDFSAYYPTWYSDSAHLSLDRDFYSGTGSMKIQSSEKSFSASPLVSVTKKLSAAEYFPDVESDYSDYGTLSFYVRNNGSTDVTFDQLKMYSYKTEFEWYSPAVEGTKDVSTVIPADGKWHKITLDLNRVYYYGNECTAAYSNEKIRYTGNMEFCFSCENENSDLNFDCVEITASTADVATRFDSDIGNADNIWEYICGFFNTIIGAIVNLFTK